MSGIERPEERKEVRRKNETGGGGGGGVKELEIEQRDRAEGKSGVTVRTLSISLRCWCVNYCRYWYIYGVRVGVAYLWCRWGWLDDWR